MRSTRMALYATSFVWYITGAIAAVIRHYTDSDTAMIYFIAVAASASLAFGVAEFVIMLKEDDDA